MKLLLFFSLLFTGIFCANLQADEVTLQDGLNSYEGATDTYLSGNPESTRTLNYGASPTLAVSGVVTTGTGKGALIQFSDLTGTGKIPPGAAIQNATLELFKIKDYGTQTVYDGLQPQDRRLNAFRVIIPWIAGVGQGSKDDTGATFEQRSSRDGTPVPWGENNKSINGPVREVDYTRKGSATADPVFGEKGVWVSWNVTEFVQQWIDDPQSNHGMIIMARTSDLGAAFESCDSENQMLRPRLVVTY